MKVSSTTSQVEYCPVCLHGIQKGQCGVCGWVQLDPLDPFEEEIDGYRIHSCLYRSPQEELLRVQREGSPYLLRRLIKPKEIEIEEGGAYGTPPVCEGYFAGTPYMVWPWPKTTALSRKGMSPRRAVAAFNAIRESLICRLERGGVEPQPWEVVQYEEGWSLLTGWERVALDRLPPPGALASPERFRGGARSRESRVFTFGALLYTFATGDLPQGLLSVPSKKRYNPDRFDLLVARALRVKPKDRISLEDFDKSLASALGVQSPGRALLQYVGAALGLLLLVGIGYGVSAVLRSL